jgi:hypothetical protein
MRITLTRPNDNKTFIYLVSEKDHLRVSIGSPVRGTQSKIKTTNEQIFRWEDVIKALNVDVKPTEHSWTAIVV